MAALYGGTTTLIDFAYMSAEKSVQAAIEARDADFAPKSPCDWAYHLMLSSEPPHTQFAELGEAIQAGYPTIKIFTTNIWPHRTGRLIDFGDIWETFKVLAKEGGLGVIHAEDNDIVMHMYAKLIRENRAGFENMAEVHNALSEDLSFRRVIRLAESVPGTALYMMHVSAATGVAAISEARARGLPIYGESLHQYMLHTAEDYNLPNGQIYHTYPSLKSAEDQKALWAGTLSGAINCVATDELCCTLREKTMGRRIDDTTGGNSGVEPRLGVMYGDGGAARLSAAALRRPRFDQRRQGHGPHREGRDRRRQRCRYRHPRSDAARQGAQGGPARGPTTAPEGHDIFAWPVGDAAAARQDRGGERAVPWPRRRRPLPPPQDSLRDHRRARVVRT
jgi:dihydropyrimidinase